MIIIDHFLPDKVFKNLQKYCKKNKFSIVQAGEKEFSVLEVPKKIYRFLQIKDSDIVLAFIRSAHRDFDDKERIHCDGIIMSRKIEKASVLYINDSEGVTPNGTKFYSHVKHGEFLHDESEEEFNRLIIEDSEDLSKWTEVDVVRSEPNRLVHYNANRFHGKWPAKIEEGTRIVLVVFYAKKE